MDNLVDSFKPLLGLVDNAASYLVFIVAWLFRNIWVRQSVIESEIQRQYKDLDDRSQVRHDKLRDMLEDQHSSTMQVIINHTEKDHS